MVPDNPPPIVRLTALAEDHARHMDTDVGEFPTQGDWYGTLELDAITPVYRNHSRLDITLDYDGRGNLTGQMAGKVSAAKTNNDIPCTLNVASPAMLSATLTGQYTPGTNTMSLTVREPNIVKGRLVCPPVPGGSDYGHGLIDQPVLDQLLRGLAIKADGSVDATREDASASNNLVRVKLTLRRVQN
jgi:hypothetical protein